MTMPVKYFAPKVTVKLCIIDFINMLFISTGIFDDKLRTQIVSVGTTANAALSHTLLDV
jgi:hypothetical protein